MTVVAGTVRVRPDKRDEAIRVALTMAKATQAESGCRTYRFYADLEDPSLFFIFEEWESEEALGAHFQTAHMAAFQAALPALVAGAPDIRFYNVESVRSM
jgi:quinol monooxygenase YgiN